MEDVPLPDFSMFNILDNSEHDFEVSDCNSIPYITADQLAEVIQNEELTQMYTIIDCRFDYEYEAGHIRNALPFIGTQSLFQFFENEQSQGQLNYPLLCNHNEYFNDPGEQINIVFHCELSKNRGPDCASLLRTVDRLINSERYPFLSCPNVFVLQGGYRAFYNSHPDCCVGGYCKMDDFPFLVSQRKREREMIFNEVYLSWNQENNNCDFSMGHSQPELLNFSSAMPMQFCINM